MRLVGNLHAEMLLGLSLRGAGAVSSFALLWLIARTFGADAVGLYQIGLATITLLSAAVALGLPELVIRQLSRLIGRDELGDARATLLACCRSVGWRGIAGGVLLAVLAVPFSRHVLAEPEAAWFLISFAPAVLLLAMLRLTNAFLRTTGRVIASQSLEGVFYTTLAAGALAIAWAIGEAREPLLPVWFYQIGIVLAALISWLLTRRVIAGWPQRGAVLIKPNDGIFIAAAPLIGYAFDWLVLLIITRMLGLEEAGIYRTAFQFCLLFMLINTSFATMAGPHIARAGGEGDQARVKSIVRSAALVGLGLSLPFAIIGWAVPEWLLGLFGPEFRRGALAMQILILAQVINVGFGPVGTALVMLRRERFVLLFEAVAILGGVAIAWLLVEPYGITGVAVGPLLASAIRNVANWVRLRAVLARDDLTLESDRAA